MQFKHPRSAIVSCGLALVLGFAAPSVALAATDDGSAGDDSLVTQAAEDLAALSEEPSVTAPENQDGIEVSTGSEDTTEAPETDGAVDETADGSNAVDEAPVQEQQAPEEPQVEQTAEPAMTTQSTEPTADSSGLTVLADPGDNKQEDSLKNVPEGYYMIGSALNYTTVLDVAGGSSSNGANVQVYTANGTDAQRWYLTYVGDGYYTIRHVGTQQMLEVQSADPRIENLSPDGTYAERPDYRPLTKFWRVGRGIAEKLAIYGIDTMGKLARMSVQNEGLLYRLFGVNAELLIDHAWGWEPCTMESVKAYRPETNSFSSGQVLQEPYTFKKARVVIQEMAEGMALDLVSKRLMTDQLVLTVGYDAECLTRPEIREKYHGEITTNYYGKAVPKHAHGTFNFESPTSSSRLIMDGATELFDRLVNSDLLIRRLNLTTNHVVSEATVSAQDNAPQQLDLFTDYEALEKQRQEEQAKLDKERRMQEAQLKIKKRFGKNAILRGLNFEEGATAKERNEQIGGHKA